MKAIVTDNFLFKGNSVFHFEDVFNCCKIGTSTNVVSKLTLGKVNEGIDIDREF